MGSDCIKKHPTSDMLINHAMGNSSEAESLIISAHLSYCSDCKKDVYEYENLAVISCMIMIRLNYHLNCLKKF